MDQQHEVLLSFRKSSSDMRQCWHRMVPVVPMVVKWCLGLFSGILNSGMVTLSPDPPENFLVGVLAVLGGLPSMESVASAAALQRQGRHSAHDIEAKPTKKKTQARADSSRAFLDRGDGLSGFSSFTLTSSSPEMQAEDQPGIKNKKMKAANRTSWFVICGVFHFQLTFLGVGLRLQLNRL